MSQADKRSSENSPFWCWPSLLGLDAPIVAVTWQALIAKGLGLDLPITHQIALFLSVWIIYLADRLFDSLRAPASAQLTSRLRFAKRFRYLFLTLLAGIAITNTLLIWLTLPREMIWLGVLLSALLLPYFALRFSKELQARIPIPREVLCGFLFALGSVLTLFPYTANEKLLPIVLLLSIPCAVNCILTSLHESPEDLAAGDVSIVSSHPWIGQTIHRLLWLISIAYSLWASIHPSALSLSLAASLVLLLLLSIFQKRIRSESFGVIADLSLLTPLPFLFFS